MEYDSYFLTVLRYIHQNPLKAKIARSVAESKWISYQEYVQKANLVDVDFGLAYFSRDRSKALPLFIKFINEDNEDQCLEYIDKVRLSDDEVRKYLHKFGIRNISELQQLDIKKRNSLLGRLKKIQGITIRQIARVTGISKSVVERA